MNLRESFNAALERPENYNRNGSLKYNFVETDVFLDCSDFVNPDLLDKWLDKAFTELESEVA